jgi:1-acyl-sn-glycerol-3-phosphate acyltransferase
MDIFIFYLKTALFLSVTLVLAPLYIFILLVFYPWRCRIGPRLVQLYSKLCLTIFRVAIDRTNSSQFNVGPKKGMLIIANHVSFLDIFVLSASFGSVFVSKEEVKYYPIFGQIAWLMGVIFFNRAASHERLRVLNTITDKCSDRILVVFPQGTTSRITERLPFNRGIFKITELNPDISLLPVTLHYREDADIAWHKPQSLKENALKVCVQKNIQVKVIIHAPVTIEHYREKTASQICKLVEQTVLEPLQQEY